MKDIRIFVASSKELLPERNYLAYLVLSKEEEFAARGLQVRLAKWEYVDPRMTGARTEDRYLDEMYDCDAAFVLFRNIAGMYTREELDKAIAVEREGWSRLKAHRILFAADGTLDSCAAKLRAELPEDSYGVWEGMEELQAAFMALVDRVAGMELREAPSDRNVRKITAFLAADEELAEERNAFADTVLNVNELLEQAHRNIRVQLKFYDQANAESVIESSEMGLVLYGTNYRVFGREELERIYARVKDGQGNPKRFYVFFRDLDEATEKSLDETFKAFRSDFVTKLGHFTCQFGDANALRLGFLLSLERYAGDERYTGEPVEIYSTVGAPTAPVFVGREDELRELCRLLEPVPGQFPAGRLPVITGAGGTGKSELVRQFASQLRVQYPGGVFQVDMEHVKTWDEAFLGILKGVPNNGVKVKKYLGLEEEEGNSPMTGAKVRDALLAKAHVAGSILLFLDNVERFEQLFGDGDAHSKAFPAGFSERVRVDVVATARACDVAPGPADWVVPFPLGDLSPEAALDLLRANKPVDGEKEIAAAKRITELLGCRALYLRRVPAILNGGNKKARIVCGSYATLAEVLEKDPLLTINRTATVEAEYLPGRLWKLVRNNLEEWGLGEACIKLVHIASFFSPDGFPRHILRHLWNELVFPELEDWGSQEEVFERAFDLAKQYNIFQSADPVRIHRLDREAILQTAEGEAGLEEAIGKVLASYEGMSPNNWKHLADRIGILRFIPEVVLSCREESCQTSLQAKLLCLNPAFEDECRWRYFSGCDWAELLDTKPQLAQRCSWEKLNGWDWASLLGKQPQFSERCSWKKLESCDWRILLCKQPQFVGKFVAVFNWGLFSFYDWAELLRERPQFSDKCPWDELDGTCWSILLGKQPQLADRCAWDKLDGSDWAFLLGEQPHFADKCERDKLDAWAWTCLLGAQPQFAVKCPWNKLNASYRAWLLHEQPQFADKCEWNKLDGRDWASLLGEQPQFADKCGWNKLNAWDWACLLADQAQFADKCPWNKLDGKAWSLLLKYQPQFSDKCPWEKLAGCDWASLLGKQPQLASHCPWEKLNGGAWRWLLEHQPLFADKCDWSKLLDEDWGQLIKAQPQFSDRWKER